MEIEMKNANRIPSVPGKSRFAMEHWFNTLYLKGLLFHPDDQPENIVRVTAKLSTVHPRAIMSFHLKV